MNIAITSSDPAAKPDQSVPIKAGGGVPVAVTFDVAPGADTVIEIALSAQSSSPSVLAYCNSFSQQSDVLYTATLDASDSRLLGALAGLSSGTFDCEVRWTVGSAEPTICPNFSLTVQPPMFSGAPTSEGGPTYIILDGSGNLPIGTRARLVPLPTGFKIQVSPDGATWSDGPSFVI